MLTKSTLSVSSAATARPLSEKNTPIIVRVRLRLRLGGVALQIQRVCAGVIHVGGTTWPIQDSVLCLGLCARTKTILRVRTL